MKQMRFAISLIIFVGLISITLFLSQTLDTDKDLAPADSSASTGTTAPPFSSVPASSAGVKNNGDWSLTYSTEYTPGSTDYWTSFGLNEQDVFDTSLKHSEGVANSWELRVGKGSQIYSIITSLGETVGSQGAYKDPGGWIDRVFQTVMVSGQLNTSEQPYFIHQAGTYAKDGLALPFFSPILRKKYNETEKSYTTWNWPQQAHIPTTHQSRVLVEQKIRDVGDGIIEITYVYHNFSDSDSYTFINIPWGATRKSIYPHYIIGQPDGSWTSNTPTVSWTENIFKLSEINGWLAFMNGTGQSAKGVGIVLGKDKYLHKGNSLSPRIVRFGPGGSEDLNVLATITKDNIEPNSTYMTRYYVVINTLPKIQAYANELTNKVEYGVVEYTEANATLQPYCKGSNNQGVQKLKLCSQDTALFSLYDNPIGNADPIFEIYDTQANSFLYVNDPYTLFTDNKPYKSKYQVRSLLGWALRNSAIDTESYSYVNLKTATGSDLYKGEASLMARATEEKTCTDGTDYGQCSATKPKFCDEGTLRNNCSECGCPSNKECQTDGTCKDAVSTCIDGAVLNQCSTTKPMYCESGNLVKRCSICGCGEGDECKADGECRKKIIQDLTACPGVDVDNDTKISLVDILNLLKNYEKNCEKKGSYDSCGSQDSNTDGKISLVDLMYWLQKYEESCK